MLTPHDSPTLTLASDPRSARTARDYVAAVLDEWGLGRVREEARLLTSELVTNAVLHAGTTVTLSIDLDDERQVVRITVRDGSRTQPRRRHYSALATTGRGLAMIDGAAEGFGIEASSEGKAVWFELGVPASASVSRETGRA